MKICFSVTNLELGGAQMFVIRLANELERRGHDIRIYDHWPEYRVAGMTATLSKNVRVQSYADSACIRWAVWKINAGLKLLGAGGEYRHKLNKKKFERFLNSYRPDILNSHAYFSDVVISQSALPPECVYIPTLHGEYELMAEGNTNRDHVIRHLTSALQKSRCIIYTAAKNLEAIAELPVRRPTHQINVGLDRETMPSKKTERRDLGITGEKIVLGMVSRGIPSKGWDVAISTFQSLKKEGLPVSLILIGNGNYLKRLVAAANDNDIYLLQFKDDKISYYAYYQLFDLFLFPSRFAGESVPNAVIEALSQNVPVVAARHADISRMLLEHSDHACGVTVPDNPDFSGKFFEAVFRLVGNGTADLNRLAENCPTAFKQFDLRLIADQYLALFNENRPPRQATSYI